MRCLSHFCQSVAILVHKHGSTDKEINIQFAQGFKMERDVNDSLYLNQRHFVLATPFSKIAVHLISPTAHSSYLFNISGPQRCSVKSVDYEAKTLELCSRANLVWLRCRASNRKLLDPRIFINSKRSLHSSTSQFFICNHFAGRSADR